MEILIISLVLVFIIVSLYTEIVGPAFTFLIGVIVLGIFGILTPKEILSGMANDQVAVIILLLLIGDIIRKTDIIDWLFEKVFRNTKSYRGFLTRMIIVVAGFSAFLNNTPLVAIMMPYVHNWSKKNDIKPSKLLIPLSYAAILGGCATLIGTSTNLIVNGLVTDQMIIPGLKPLELFDFTIVGLPMAILGSAYLILFGKKLLPSKSDVISDFSSKSREYFVEAQIRSNSKIIGKTIEEAGLRNLKGLFIVEISRGEQRLSAVSPSVVLREGDILVFAGDTETIAEMINTDTGLALTQVGMFRKKSNTAVLEVVVSHNSTLIAKTVRQTGFRGKYDAAILAVHRNGEKISGKIGTVKLKAGDVLLLLAGDDFTKRSNDSKDFYLISKVREFKKLKMFQSIVLFGGLFSAIAFSALGYISLFMALMILMIVIQMLKIVSPKDIPRSIDYNLAIIIVLSLAIGTAMIKTGMADIIANIIITVFKPFGPLGLLFGIFLITNLLASYITNKAAAAIIFPISVTAAISLGLPTTPFILIVAFGAAANFITPIGYQTNLMVYGPGGYSFKDYMKIGLPLTFIYMFAAVSILYFYYIY
ncbi:MAG: SLC13 family permease [Bacteroidetes bacterium 4484_249]|nr:MAG: SLC13 family permease [Bacteroidetes bacterium 4484_249]